MKIRDIRVCLNSTHFTRTHTRMQGAGNGGEIAGRLPYGSVVTTTPAARMKSAFASVRRLTRKNGANGRGDGEGPRVVVADEQPLRAELFSVSQLVQHAKSMAGWHDVAAAAHRVRGRRGPAAAAARCQRARAPRRVRRRHRRGEAGRRITPAAEWFLDNYHLIEEQIRTARRHLPRGYSRELPRLASGPSAGHPRVYAIALELISHADGRVDAESLRGFVAAYQSVTPLKLGELWAIPIMLRLALLENLRRVAVHVMTARRERDRAAYWVEQMLEVSATEPAQGRARAGGHGAGKPAADHRRSSPSSRAACRARARRWSSPSRGWSSGWPSRARRSSTSSSRRARTRRPTRFPSATASAACASSARRTGRISSRR